MPLNPYTLATLAEQPDLAERFYPQKLRIWPPFMLEDTTANRLWHHLGEDFADFQHYLLNEAGEPVAVGQAIPLRWDGTQAGLPIGWSDCLVQGASDLSSDHEPDTLAALEIAISPDYTGQRLSYTMLKAMRATAQSRGMKALIVAVRPSLKTRYPLTPMAQYVRWARDDGLPFDPWLRVHWQVGGEILHVAHPSMRIEGTVAAWEGWTGMQFPESGDYVIDFALSPIQIDRAADFGLYLEPNVWVHHPITTEWLRRS